jgi:hypothetical protein
MIDQDAMAEFEALFWEHLAGFEDLAKENPTLLVDCLRIIEIQVGSYIYRYTYTCYICAVISLLHKVGPELLTQLPDYFGFKLWYR